MWRSKAVDETAVDERPLPTGGARVFEHWRQSAGCRYPSCLHSRSAVREVREVRDMRDVRDQLGRQEVEQEEEEKDYYWTVGKLELELDV